MTRTSTGRVQVNNLSSNAGIQQVMRGISRAEDCLIGCDMANKTPLYI